MIHPLKKILKEELTLKVDLQRPSVEELKETKEKLRKYGNEKIQKYLKVSEEL